MKPILTASAIALLACLSTLHGAIYYADTNNTSTNGLDWNSADTWSSNAAPTAENDYISNNSSYSLRTPSTSSTFGGRSLTVDSTTSSAIAVGVRTGDGAVSSVNLLTLGFARITASASNNKVSRLSAGTLTFSGTLEKPTTLDSVSSGSNRTLSITATTVTGSGYVVTAGAANGIILLDFADASGFTGTLEHAIGVLTFGQELDLSNGTLLIDSTAAGVSLAYNVTVESLIIGNTTLEAGRTYTAADLNSYLNIFSGTSTITIVPEPSTYALLCLGALLLALRLRRNQLIN